MPRYASSFSTTGWDETEVTDEHKVQSNILRVTRVHTTRSINPPAPASSDSAPVASERALTFSGNATADYLLLYTSPRDTPLMEAAAVYTGFTHLVVTNLGEKECEGSVMLAVSAGKFEAGVASGEWTAVEGTAKGSLEGAKAIKGAYEAGASGAKAWIEFETVSA